MTMREILQRRVRKGSAWLDKEVPGWYNKLKLESLDLGSGVACVCGQMFGQFWSKVYDKTEPEGTLWNAPGQGKIEIEQAVRYGFYVRGRQERRHGYDMLTRLWHKQVTRLRARRNKTA